MKFPLIPSALLAVSLVLPCAAFAADDTHSKDAPHRSTRLGACSKEAHAKGLKGPDRKKYISTCLAAARAAKPVNHATASSS
jgi:hypothetical protein